ncbi:hypothetical protein OG921_15905 [Aldersonia sp. NBC_00410]|uniref:hypothetical protein n=1 Tax=Aldersonia sp. NBC_00410 TaxID=2975954 RepID=UPI00225A4BF2|nr:hypothetical protein [Aldersonia sp. NBC_00410]MCX5044652.1 hypothetical protein [Aldersonia sp. NBC_00410]
MGSRLQHRAAPPIVGHGYASERVALIADDPDVALDARVELTDLLVEADRRANES